MRLQKKPCKSKEIPTEHGERARGHRLVSRRLAAYRSPRPACRGEDRRAGDLPLRVGRDERAASAGRRRALVAGAVAAGAAGKSAIGGLVAGAASGRGGKT